MRRKHPIQLLAAVTVMTLAAAITWAATANAAGGPNLSLGKTATASSTNGPYPAGNLNDGNPATYWESSNNSFPQWAQIDLGVSTSIDQVVLKLPSGWETRTQTLSIDGSANGSTFTTIVGASGRTFPQGSNTVVIDFAAASTRYVRVNITANTGWPAAQLSELEIYGATSPGSNLALGKPMSESGHAQNYVAANANDANQATYWESANNAFPQHLQVDLLSSLTVDRVVLKTPVSGWGARTQTLSVQGSTNGSTYTDIVPSAAYTFQPSAANTVTIDFAPTSRRYIRIRVTANTGWPAGQISELEVYGPGGPADTAPPSVPGTLSYTQSGTTINLSWGASTDTGGSGLAGYDIYRNGTLTGSVGATTTTFADTQPVTATVAYYVRARDGAGNLSANSNTVTRPGTTDDANLALNKPVTATGSVFTFVPANATDADLGTYWEGTPSYPQDVTVALGANHVINRVVVKLNPDPAWGTRTQNFQILGRDQASSTYTNLVSAANYQFVQGTNVVTIPVSATTADVRLRFNSNTGAPSGQVAELEVWGMAAPNPDLTVTAASWTPASPTEASTITLSATVRNAGTASAAATTVNFNLGGTVVGTAAVAPLAPSATATVTLDIGNRPMGNYSVSATVDPSNTVIEQNDGNNTFTSSSPMVVAQAPGPDLQVLSISANPPNPAVGASVSFIVAVHNRGTTASGLTSVTRVTVGSTTLSGNTISVAAGATVSVTMTGTWTATAGGASITAVADATNVVAETNESNNTFSQSIVVGRGAAVPYTSYEAEAANYQGTLLSADPLRTFGHTNFATESSGRQSVRLDNTGQFVEFTSTNQSNSIVVRNSIPDAPAGGGIEATISLYINGTFDRKITLSSRHSWLYGLTDDTEGLQNTPQPDAARRLFDESQVLLPQSYPPGTRFRLQRDGGDTAQFYIIDLIDLEQVAPPLEKPAECTSIEAYGAVPDDGLDDTTAIQRAVTDDENGVISCVWIPAGQWRQEQKILSPDPSRTGFNQRGIRNVVIRGAGMWHSRLYTNTQPQNVVGNINHPHEGNVGFDIDDNTQISDLAIFGNTQNRNTRGHGLNGRFGHDTRISNVWIEHVNVGAWVGRDYSDTPAYWNPGDGLEFTGMRIRNTYADGINFSNGTRNSRVFNSSFRNTGDDSLAIWANPFVRDPSVDIGHDNKLVNNTIQLPWRANGAAIYGGYNNSIENNLIFDTMNYPGIMLATDHTPLPFSGTTLIANNGLFRCGGVFWGEAQEFGAITLFAPTTPITGVTIRDTEIVDSTYDGIQFKSGTMPSVAITNVRIDKSNNGAGILAMSAAQGSATLTNVTITNSADGDIVRQPGTSFVINGG